MKLSAFESNQIYRENLVWLVTAQAAAIVPLLRFLPLWISAIWLLALLWRLLIYRGRLDYPGVVLKLTFACAAVLGIYINFGGQISAESMVAFLVCSFIMKIIEMRTRKDALVVLFIAFIAISSQFLFAQDIAAAIYGFASLLVLISAWSSIFRTTKLTVWRHLVAGAKLILFSLPMMLVLFVIMPRLGPLWSVPLPGNKGNMGFSESMQLGDVGELVRSPEVAFRAKFNNAAPAPRDLYWRGLVLDRFDGSRWTSEAVDQELTGPVSMFSLLADETNLPDFDYSVVMEPHNYRWLFSVGWPSNASSAQVSVSANYDGILFAQRPVFQKIEYHVQAQRDAPGKLLSERARRANIRLPENDNPRAKELAEHWRQSFDSDQEIVEQGLGLFASAFSYTLRVDQVKVNAIDYFLFESKRGFCEHFASSFVFLMRSAGIPARIVIGYQGGELNDVDQYYIVRQSDAHAWAEIWLTGQGWVKIDPTSSVAPNRIEIGVDEALDPEDRKLLANSWNSNKALLRLSYYWDSMSYSWSNWVLNFDKQKQEGLITKLLGSADPMRIALALALLAFFGLTPAVVYHRWRSRQRFDFVENRIVQPVLQKLHKQGVEKSAAESFSAFMQRTAARASHSPDEFLALAQCYERRCYQGRGREDLAQLRELSKRCLKLLRTRGLKWH